jgi:hypothetical protein
VRQLELAVDTLCNLCIKCCCCYYCCSNLPQTPFTGPLPPSWGDLREPVSFDLEFNWFTGTLPANWGKLSSLKLL